MQAPQENVVVVVLLLSHHITVGFETGVATKGVRRSQNGSQHAGLTEKSWLVHAELARYEKPGHKHQRVVIIMDTASASPLILLVVVVRWGRGPVTNAVEPQKPDNRDQAARESQVASPDSKVFAQPFASDHGQIHHLIFSRRQLLRIQPIGQGKQLICDARWHAARKQPYRARLQVLHVLLPQQNIDEKLEKLQPNEPKVGLVGRLDPVARL